MYQRFSRRRQCVRLFVADLLIAFLVVLLPSSVAHGSDQISLLRRKIGSVRIACDVVRGAGVLLKAGSGHRRWFPIGHTRVREAFGLTRRQERVARRRCSRHGTIRVRPTPIAPTPTPPVVRPSPTPTVTPQVSCSLRIPANALNGTSLRDTVVGGTCLPEGGSISLIESRPRGEHLLGQGTCRNAEWSLSPSSLGSLSQGRVTLRARIAVNGTVAYSSEVSFQNFLPVEESTQCAEVMREDAEHAPPAYALCAPGGYGKICAGHLTTRNSCLEEHPFWYQAAVYRGAGLSDDGIPLGDGPGRGVSRVIFGPGVIQISRYLPAWAPLPRTVGLHVPSNSDVRGSPDPLNPTIVTAHCAPGTPTCAPPESLILISEWRTGRPGQGVLAQQGVSSVRIHDLVLNGELNSETPLCTRREDLPSIHRLAKHGIRGAKAEHGVELRNLIVCHTAGNAIDLGILAAWTPENSDAGNNGSCSLNLRQEDGRPPCAAKVLYFNGSPASPVVVRNNTIMDARFGGVTVIGSNVHVINNTIQVTDKFWRSPEQGVGSTMGVSASFAGSHHNVVLGNAIEGGDYGVGTDGSFPLLLSRDLYSSNWEYILNYFAGSDPSLRDQFPSPPTDLTELGAARRLRITQVLFDMAADKLARLGGREPGFGEAIEISSNFIYGAVVGVSMYRLRDSLVHDNTLVTDEELFSRAGVSLSHTNSSAVFANEIQDYEYGIDVVGAPGSQVPVGSLARSREGAARNLIGANPVDSSEAAGNIIRASRSAGIRMRETGVDNQILHNRITDISPHMACLYQNVPRGQIGDGTRYNVPESCNRDW